MGILIPIVPPASAAEKCLVTFAARVSQGHIGRARHLATNESVRSNRKVIMQLPLQLGSIAAAFQAAQTLIDLATEEANASSEIRDKKEIEKLQEAFGKGATGRGMATGAAKAVKELEKEQKSRATRGVRDSIDGAFLDLASFYRDVMMVQSDNSESMINLDFREQIESFAVSSPPHLTVKKIDLILAARENLARNSAPLVNCEALMCSLGIN